MVKPNSTAFPPVWKQLCRFACTHSFVFARDLGDVQHNFDQIASRLTEVIED
jgi:hypothetical protein